MYMLNLISSFFSVSIQTLSTLSRYDLATIVTYCFMKTFGFDIFMILIIFMPKNMYEILIRYFFAINCIQGRLYGSAETIRKQENVS